MYRPPAEVSDLHATVVDLSDRIWFAGLESNRIARFDPEVGHFRLYSLQYSGAGVGHLTVDVSGVIWFTDPGKDRIGRVEDTGP